MQKLTLILTSAAMLCAATLPAGIPDKVHVIRVEKPQPAMWTSCTRNEEVERKRLCRARAKSI